MRRCAALSIVALCACRPVAQSDDERDRVTSLDQRLPTGVRLAPAGRSFDVGSLPLTIIPSPESDRFILLLSGWKEQGVQVVDRGTGAVLQTVVQPAAFLGAAFSPNGRTLYTSGGNQDVVYKYLWKDKRLSLIDSLVLEPKKPNQSGRRYPSGLAISNDGRQLYVAENLADSLAVIDTESGRVIARYATERYPYAVVVAPNGTVYVSAWGGRSVHEFTPAGGGKLVEGERMMTARHPSALLLNRDGSRLFVASGSTDRVMVIDTRERRLIAELQDPPPEGPDEGSTPNALALSDDETRLFVAEADNNAIGVFDLSAKASNRGAATGRDELAGRIPVGWYPTALIASGDSLFVINGKGRGTAANPRGPQPGVSRERQGSESPSTTLSQLRGTLTAMALARANGELLKLHTAAVVANNGWNSPRRSVAEYPPFKHVIYIIKENRTYDQILGDMPQGDGDSTLLFFPRAVTPNHHELAERFGLFDRFFTNGEVSADGHNWSMAAYATDYLQKTVQSNYSSRGRTYDYEGTNRGMTAANIPEDDVAEPAQGYLWDLAQRKGISFRNYGEYVVPPATRDTGALPAGYRGDKPFLSANTNERFPGYDLSIKDQARADVWLDDLREFIRRGTMPALQIVRLPNDHTAGARAGSPTPRAMMADNDLALGRIIEELSRSPFWKNTVVFVLEDDAQNGPDHVDSHRAPMLVISPYNRPGTIHRFTNTTDALRTMEEILGLESLSQFDYYGRPLRDVFSSTADVR
ncbi:MAG: bifunctional YncE family protein/alkaline phosphatase family protein, partial [Gemmatimonadaceae bacterium]|nr:bifunctional YncE family protein/alkaline phosphatase family protein [Gemmatimonadaceae bacterium]